MKTCPSVGIRNAMDTTAPVDPDALLVARARDGDVDAFAALYRRHVGRVYDFAFRKLRVAAHAEDATQETFLRALRALPAYDERGRFVAWLLRIASSAVIDHHRLGSRLAPLPTEHAEPTDTDRTPEERIIDAESRASLELLRDECLRSDIDRALFDLTLQDLTDKEIALVLGKTHGAVRTALLRVRKKLRGCLGLMTNALGGPRVATRT
jgi:RNA polymerase sigma-70 factor, ECF subfamily